MTLLDLYKQKNKDKVWFKKFASVSQKSSGALYGYTGTNFRTQSSFLNAFETFKEVEGLERSKWPKVDSGQEKHKQHVIPMVGSKLFSKDRQGSVEDKNFIYSKTEKGKLYETFVGSGFDDINSWIINYFFIVNGVYIEEVNHILEKSNYVIENLANIGITIHDIRSKIIQAIETESMGNLLDLDVFYWMAFYDDVDFLEIFMRSSTIERKELSVYIKTHLKPNNFSCISQKCYTSGPYSVPMFLDEIKALFITSFIKESNIKDVNGMIYKLISEYSKLLPEANIDDSKKFIEAHKSIFGSVIGDVLDSEQQDDLIINSLERIVTEESSPEDFIDDTTIDGKREANLIFSRKKKHTRILGEYKCSLEDLNNCKYFTSKKTDNNYIEIHHIIPREFRNEFSNSIEVFSNYATLCPHCHQLIHKGIDGERISSLNFLYNNRKEKLKLLGLNIEVDELYKFYRVSI